MCNLAYQFPFDVSQDKDVAVRFIFAVQNINVTNKASDVVRKKSLVTHLIAKLNQLPFGIIIYVVYCFYPCKGKTQVGIVDTTTYKTPMV